MSGHVAPARFADALAGRLSPAERAADEVHARGCPRCAAVQARVARASDTFATIRAQPAPELPWDAVRARVHWAVSKEKRLGTGAPVARPRWPWAVAALAVAAGTALVVTRADAPARTSIAAAPGLAAPPSPEARPGPAPLVGLVSRSAGEIRVDGAPATDLYTRTLGAGRVLATDDGRLDVQFGDGSAFALGPRSTVELRRFDAEAVELVVRGTLDVEVAPRTAGQRFVVIAGDREVVVRGTQFRVEHGADGTAVACRHGLVVVRDAQAEVELGAARRIALLAAAPLSPARVEPLTVDELDALAAATPLRGPLWDPAALLAGSAPLAIEAGAAPRAVRLDGVEIGLAPLVVRVMPGRHTVEATDSAGRFRRVGWVDVAAPAGAASVAPARLALPAEPRTGASTASSAQRRRQLRDGLDRARLAPCLRSIARAGLTGTYVEIEIAVEASGAVAYLNVLDTDLPSATTRCVHKVLEGVRFGVGAAASWRERIDL